VTAIGRDCFSRCESLATVTFEPGSQLRTVEPGVFADCSLLSSIWIPASIETTMKEYRGFVKVIGRDGN
jgi:hypothetical protein